MTPRYTLAIIAGCAALASTIAQDCTPARLKGKAALKGEVAPAKAVDAPLCLSRTRLSAEPDRDTLLAWSPGGTLDPLAWTFGGRHVQPEPASMVSEVFYDAAVYGLFRLPVGTPPGRHVLDCGSGTAVVEVVTPTKRKLRRIPANESSSLNIAKAVADGCLEIILEPGEHRMRAMVVLPANTVVRGYGATVVRDYVVPYGSKWPAFYLGGDDIAVYGVTFRYERPSEVFLSLNEPFPSGFVLADCQFHGCNLGFYVRGAFLRDNRFTSAGSVIAPSGLWLRCTFTGPPTQHAWQHWPGLGPVAMIDCLFDGTDRGPCFLGEITDPLFVGTGLQNINRTPNGNESFLSEGPIRRLVALHTRAVGCFGTVFQFDSVAEDVYVRDLQVDGGAGLLLWGKVRRLSLIDFELSRCGCYLGTAAEDCRLEAGIVTQFQRTRGGQHFKNESRMGYRRTIALWDEGVRNGMKDVDVLDLAPGLTAARGWGRQ